MSRSFLQITCVLIYLLTMTSGSCDVTTHEEKHQPDIVFIIVDLPVLDGPTKKTRLVIGLIAINISSSFCGCWAPPYGPSALNRQALAGSTSRPAPSPSPLQP